MKPELFVGNLNYSSWSLRPYLALSWAGIDFDLREIDLDQPGYGGEGIAQIRALTPTAKVPVLRIGEITVADSLAISEWAHETGSLCDTLLADAAYLAWEARLLAEPAHAFSRSNTDQLYA